MSTATRRGPSTHKILQIFAGVAAQSATALGVARLHQEVLRRERLERDLKLAENIQKSFVPAKTPELARFELAVHYRPARGVSGDYYDFVRLSSGRWAIVIADVMGKGLGAALHMARLTRDLRHAATFAEDPAELLGRLNAASHDLGQTNAFVTMTIVVLDPERPEIRYSSAGHGPLLIRSAGEGQVLTLEPEPASALGMFEDTEFSTSAHRLAPGDGHRPPHGRDHRGRGLGGRDARPRGRGAGDRPRSLGRRPLTYLPCSARRAPIRQAGPQRTILRW